MALTITQQEKEGITLLELKGNLIFGEERDSFYEQIYYLLEANRPKIVLKMEGTNFCDSSGLGCLITAFKATRDRGGDLKLLKPSEKVQALLDLTKLNTIFDIHTEEDKAVASFKRLTSLKGLAMKTKKRRNPRISTDLFAQVEILPEKITLLGRLDNLNKDGVLFHTTDSADPGTKVIVRFNLPPIIPGTPVQAEGVVVHSKEGAHMGIQFSSLQEAYANAIAKYIEGRSS